MLAQPAILHHPRHCQCTGRRRCAAPLACRRSANRARAKNMSAACARSRTHGRSRGSATTRRPVGACTDRAMPRSRAARTSAGVAPAGLALDTHGNIVIGPPRSRCGPARSTPVTVGLPGSVHAIGTWAPGAPARGRATASPARQLARSGRPACCSRSGPAQPRHTRSLFCTASGPPGHGAEPGSGSNGNGARSLARPGGAGESWGGTSFRAARHSSLEDEPDVEPMALTAIIRGWKLGHWPRRGGA